MYAWLVFIHLVGVVLFALGHGASAFAAFRIRGARDSQMLAEHLTMSQLALGPMYVGLLLIGIGGLGAAWSAGFLLAPWVVASYVVLVVVLGTMYAVAAPYYGGLRKLVAEGAGPVDWQDVAARLRTRRPEVLLAVGAIGLLVLVWLMTFRPS
jgi:hypothetical protein